MKVMTTSVDRTILRILVSHAWLRAWWRIRTTLSLVACMLQEGVGVGGAHFQLGWTKLVNGAPSSVRRRSARVA